MKNSKREFDPAVGDIFHAMVKAGSKLRMKNGVIPGPRRISTTAMPLRGQWLPPVELIEMCRNSRWIDLD